MGAGRRDGQAPRGESGMTRLPFFLSLEACNIDESDFDEEDDCDADAVPQLVVVLALSLVARRPCPSAGPCPSSDDDDDGLSMTSTESASSPASSTSRLRRCCFLRFFFTIDGRSSSSMHRRRRTCPFVCCLSDYRCRVPRTAGCCCGGDFGGGAVVVGCDGTPLGCRCPVRRRSEGRVQRRRATRTAERRDAPVSSVAVSRLAAVLILSCSLLSSINSYWNCRIRRSLSATGSSTTISPSTTSLVREAGSAEAASSAMVANAILCVEHSWKDNVW